MLASQLLYTSWKNGESTTKGYMVYSKSSDINSLEEEEITKAMKYLPPNGLPFDPTDEQIETLFPKTFAYFKLSSGRICIAKSTYVGQDYSGRTGNYLIHAYVLDDVEDLIPARMIDSVAFRNRLSDEELNVDRAPESLPKVELNADECKILSAEEMESFFNSPQRIGALKSLTQAVCDAMESGTRVILSDDYSNMKIWVAALSMVIPQKILKNLYFSTYDSSYSPLVTLSCQHLSQETQMYQSNDLKVINAEHFENNGESISLYVDVLCDKLMEDYYEGILCTCNVNGIMEDYECTDCNLAYKLSCVISGDLDCINSNDELLQILQYLEAHTDIVSKDVYDTIFSKYSSKELYNGDETSISVLKNIYPNISSNSRVDLLMMYVDLKLGSGESCVLRISSIKRDCPCAWDEAVKCFLRQSFRDHLSSRSGNASELLECISWIAVYDKCNADQCDGIYKKICELYTKQLNARDIASVTYILDECKQISNDLYRSIYLSVCYDTANTLSFDDKLLFQYLKLSVNQDPDELFWRVLVNEIDAQPQKEELYMHELISFKNEIDNITWDELLKIGASNERAERIIKNIDIYVFESENIFEPKALIGAYEKYIIDSDYDDNAKNKFKAIFYRKVKSTLDGLKVKESIKFAANLYDNIHFDATMSNGDKKLFDLIVGSIYNDDNKSISLINKQLSDARSENMALEISAICDCLGISVYPRLCLICEGYMLRTAAEKRDAVFKEKVQNDTLTFASGKYSSSLIKEFTESYISDLLKVIYMLYNMNDDLDTVYLIDHLLAPIYKSNVNFDKVILEAWKEDISLTNDNMDVYFIYIFTSTSTGTFRNKIYDIVEKYLSYIGKGKRNALFDSLTELFANSDKEIYSKDCLNKMKKYISSFNQNHRSLWDVIKGIFSVKGQEKKNGNK